MKILVTGANGLIGTALCEKLKDKHELIRVDKKNGKIENLLNIGNSFFQELDWIDMVVHLANNARVRKLVKYPELAKENIDMNYNIMNYCVQKKIPRFLMASSRETYGNQNLESCKETDAHSWLCESPYTSSKFMGESYAMALRTCYGIKPIIVRLSNVFGPSDPQKDRFIPIVFKKLMNNNDVVIYGGDKILDFTYIDDCVAGIEVVIDNFDQLSNTDIPIYNIAYGKESDLLMSQNILRKDWDQKVKL